ncbi:MAG: hypothetical protein MJ096_02890 [Clostridia bacterium]|nr:hypothetical protein [Clostridia bacterium]
MAEKKKKIVQSQSTGDGTVIQAAKPVGNATGLRIGAIVCWILGLACEVFAILAIFEKIHIFKQGAIDLVSVIGFLVIDLIFVAIGSLLWKKSNRIDPASEKNKVKFWLWNNLGLIITAVAFIPFIVIVLTNKNADKKTKTIAVVVAAVALLIGGLIGYEWNPVSSEQLQAAQNALGDTPVFWTVNGSTVHKYHIDSDCYHLNNAKSDEIHTGTVEQAFAENATALCKTCQKKHQEIGGINNVDTGDGVKNVETEAAGSIDIVTDDTSASTEAE